MMRMEPFQKMEHPRWEWDLYPGDLRVRRHFRGPVLKTSELAPASLENMDHHQSSSVDDHLLICLQADDWREADAARKIFHAMGASNITVGGEKASRLITQTFQRFEAEAELQAF
jgi:hypothetical protein